MRVVRSPLRLSIGGGGTDIPAYCNERKGDLIFSTIDKYVYIFAEQRIDGKNIVSIENSSEKINQLTSSSNEYVAAVSERLGLDDTAIRISSASKVPSGTGLGSSGSFAVCLIQLLSRFSQENLDTNELAEEAFKIENKKLNQKCGKQDQYAAALGGFKRLRISREQKTSVRDIDIDKNDLDKLEESIMLFYTEEERSSSDVLKHQKKELKQSGLKMDEMDRIKKIGQRIHKSLEEGNIDMYGSLLHEHWTTKKKFSDKMTNHKIDKMYSCARDNGAIGGKIVGAGGGGFLMLYAQKEYQQKIKKKLRDLGARHMDFNFSNHGCEVVYEQ